MPKHDWYAESRELFKAIYSDDWKLFAALVAATSPFSTIKSNLTLATKAYNQIKSTGNVDRASFTRSHYHQIQLVLETGQPHGQKVEAFYANLLGNSAPVTIDRWMMRSQGFTHDVPTANEYQAIQDKLTAEATTLGITPSQHQANLWAAVKGSQKSYADYCKQYRLF